VASCTRQSTPGSASSESTLSPPPESPSLDPANTIAVQSRGGEGESRFVGRFGDVGNSLGQGQNQRIAEQDGATLNQVNQSSNNEISSQRAASNQVSDNQKPIQRGDNNDFTHFTISPYISGEFDEYEIQVVKTAQNQDEPDADSKEDELSNDLDDPKVSDELKAIDEEDNLDDPVTPNNEVDTTQVIEDDLYGADTPRVEPATPQVMEEDDIYGADTPLPASPQAVEDDIYGTDTPLPEPATPQAVEEDIYGADTPRTNDIRADAPRAETPTPLGAAESVEGSDINGSGAIKASEALTNAFHEQAGDASTLQVPAEPIGGGADILQPSKPVGADLPKPSQLTADSEVASQVAGEFEEKAEKITFKFKKFTPISAFEDFLKDSENMQYDELYHRTAAVADVLQAYQNEYDEVNQELFAYEKRKTTLKEYADEEKKAAEEKNKLDNKEVNLAEDRLLMAMFKKYEPKLKLRNTKWLAFLAEFEQNGGEPKTIERLKRLHEPVFVSALAKRLRAYQKENENKKKKVILVGGDLPPLKKSDLEPHVKKRKVVKDRVVFDDMKQSDVYQQTYNPRMYGNQKLKDVNSEDFKKEDEVNENGRPKRTAAKRAFYDSHDSDTTPDIEADNLPAKRARTKRILDDGIASPGRPQTLFESRDGTPARVFPSGKRIGRPPGSKTKNPGGRAAQSKLNTVQVAEPSESEGETGHAQNNQVESRAQELEPAQEQQLQAAASSLVAQTEEAIAAPAPPAKKKHAGGRPKKNAVIEEPVAGPSSAPVEEVPIVPKPKNKGGRPRKYPAPAVGAKGRGGRAKKQPAVQQAVQVGEEEEIIQSTEHDNESMFPSTASSRPTTSSSSGTDATFGGRQTRRATTRGKSQAQSASVEAQLDAPGPSAPTNGRGKRKRTVTDDIQSTQPVQSAAQSGDSEGDNIVVDTYRPDLLEDPTPPTKKRKPARAKKGKGAQTVPQPIAAQEVTPEQTGEASQNTTGRPKRKRVAALPESSIDPDQLGEYLSDDDGDTPPPPKRRNVRGGRKGKSVKREQTTDGDTGVDTGSSVPPSRKRPARAATKRNTIKQEVFDEESSGDQVPQPPKTRKSRTNTLIVAEGAGAISVSASFMEDIGAGPSAAAPKKRPVSRGKLGAKDVEVVGETAILPKKRKATVSKGKGVALGDINEPEQIKSEGAEIQNGDENAGHELGGGGENMADGDSAPPAKKRKTRTIKGKAAKTESTGDDDFSDSEDYTGMDPTQAELLRKKKRKSKKLAAATRKRWANGTMKGPMEKRKATNAAKKAAKLAAKQIGGLDGVAETVVAGSAEPAGDHGEEGENDALVGGLGMATGGTMAAVDTMTTGVGSNVGLMTAGVTVAGVGPMPAPARSSTRVRKPTSRAMGLDGADDSDEGEFRSEYDHFQALSSPKGATLGKRARKSYIGFDDEEDSF
jgi:hypothetical protein